ncbi:MAG: VOC family protein [Deltaproteobacteria bacterium]|nr:VOC family protein [Deltaproteobacteria bacterium]
MTSRTSAIAFAPAMRPHIALAVSDVDAARTFYETLLQTAPSKVRPGYVKFEPELPALNLTLNHDPEHAGQRGAAHFGVQVQSTDAVAAATERLQAAGMQVLVEEQTTCCFAVQDKVWAIDPDGHRWEVFVVTDADAPVHSLPGAARPDACCDTDQMAAAKAAACC